ncbi:hydroxyacylglutathione hydrolase [Cribrihabitans marinus]|uniref:Hydroxyacylglutathione hydrolase n=1 Tax=Cribrihabitans marinus TaxID=1227549 RepID=A0A1H7AFI1_9RHOB|nr:hydroxyacylglutathione hydrolase [Cribrihabitans marinus]GGH31633.1 hydroxyacylglutathione hydrolase [Cribrihabitans marinus]SEJ64349.1 hydroxyacylglutathione hydrolase [Cribrihabitans marinus]
MPLEIVTIPCLSDNYAFLAHDAASGETALVDAPEAGPILAALSDRGWRLSHVLLTHHHWDHVDGLAKILAAHPAQVVGAAADAHRLPPLDVAVAEGDGITIGGEPVEVIDVSGHTVGHVAYHMPESKAVFTADSLMALGCGRLFEGSPEQMWASLSKLAALPKDTLVCSGHEYTQTNGRFAETIEPDNPALQTRIAEIAEARATGRPTVPSRLDVELATNPFLRAAEPGIQTRLGLEGADAVTTFTEIRARKDKF